MKALPITLAVALLTSSAIAEIPQTVHHQGRIVADGVNFDGTGSFKFLLYHGASSGVISAPLWTNAESAPAGSGEPASALAVPVTKGLYSVALGAAPQAPLLANLAPKAGQNLYLRIWFDDGTNGFQWLSPDRGIAAVPFARHADIAGQNISLLNNDAGFLSEESFEFTMESGSAAYDEAELGGTSGSFSTTVAFTETYNDIPSVVLEQTSGLNNPTVTNVTTTGFDLAFDYAFTETTNVVPTTQPWSKFELLIADGLPAMLYAEGTVVPHSMHASGFEDAPKIQYWRADASGVMRGAPITLGTGLARGTAPQFSVPFFPKLFDTAIIGGRPAAVYIAFSETSSALVFQRGENAQGSSWGAAIEIRTPGSLFAGVDLSLGIISGHPAVLERQGVGLKYHRATDSAGTGWTSTDLTGVPFGFYTQVSNLHEIGGNPALAYFESDSSPPSSADPYVFIKLIKATAPDGSTWGAPVTIWSASEDDLSVGGATAHPNGIFEAPPVIRLFDVDGRPAIAFTSALSSNHGLIYARANNAAGSSWPPPLRPAAHGPSFPASSELIRTVDEIEIGGVPTLMFKRGEDFLSIAADQPGPAPWGSEIVRATGVAGEIAMADNGGIPALAYSDYTSIPPDATHGVNYAQPPVGGSLSLRTTQRPFVAWSADDPADTELQQQQLSFDGAQLSISAGNSVDLSSLNVTDHGALSGLLDDDHPQYFLGNGSEPFGGNLNLGGNSIIGVGSLTVSGSVSLPNGAVNSASLSANVMLQGENVSLLNNDAGYLTAGTLNPNIMVEGEGVSLLNNDAGYIPSTGDATLNGDLMVTGTLNAGLGTSALGVRSTAFGHNTAAAGLNAFSWGFDTDAIGTSTTAWGSGTSAGGARSTAWGLGSATAGAQSTAWGNGSTAGGDTSTAWGHSTTAESFAETVLGHFDTDYSPLSTTLWKSSDRLFVIGNGTSDASRADALVMTKTGDTTLNGNLGIGTAPRVDSQLTTQASATAPNNITMASSGANLPTVYWALAANDDVGAASLDNDLLLKFSSNGTIFSNRGAFDATSGAYSALSDRRHKKNIAPLEDALPKVERLPLHRFHFNGQPDEAPPELGVIAQELQEVYPTLVNDADGTLTVNYAALSVVALKALQEQQAIIDSLTERLERLEQRTPKQAP